MIINNRFFFASLIKATSRVMKWRNIAVPCTRSQSISGPWGKVHRWTETFLLVHLCIDTRWKKNTILAQGPRCDTYIIVRTMEKHSTLSEWRMASLSTRIPWTLASCMVATDEWRGEGSAVQAGALSCQTLLTCSGQQQIKWARLLF